MAGAVGPQPEPRPGGPARWAVGVGIVTAVAAGLVFAWQNWPQPLAPAELPPPTPTRSGPEPTATTPYLNAAPGVGYTGDAACADCHPAHAATYHRHPMGRSLTPIAEVAARPGYPPQPGKPFDALGLQFDVERRGDRIVHREVARDRDRRPVATTEAAVAYAVGSGAHARSYLIRDGAALTLSPITWYTQKDAWGLSPAFEAIPDRFERPVAAGCLFCHANHAEPDPDTLNSYREPVFTGHAIGCERCHGPASLHVRARRAAEPVADPDLTIVNPARLEPALREAVCEQCHLGGRERVLRRGRGPFDFRPGLPLEAFWRVLVLPPDAAQGNRVAGHVEQMHASRCFQASAGKLGCVSCHDPHAVPRPEEREGYFRDRCLTCHQSRGCTEPPARRREVTPGDACTTCHMPRGETNIGHVSLTDHRVPRRPDPKVAAAEPPSAGRLVPFGHDRVDPGDAELARDLAVGLVARARTRPALRAEVSRTFLPALDRAVRSHPDDLAARESLGVALAWQGRPDLALAACDATLAAAPRRELVLSDAGLISRTTGQPDRSLDYWRRALAVNPSSSRYRFEVAALLAQRGEWEAAAAECRRVLARNGSHQGTRLVLVQYYLHHGMKPQARGELEAVLAFGPPNAAELRRTFGELLR